MATAFTHTYIYVVTAAFNNIVAPNIYKDITAATTHLQ